MTLLQTVTNEKVDNPVPENDGYDTLNNWQLISRFNSETEHEFLNATGYSVDKCKIVTTSRVQKLDLEGGFITTQNSVYKLGDVNQKWLDSLVAYDIKLESFDKTCN